MKSLRQLCVAVVFALALATSTFAGGIEIGSPAPPLPSQPQTAAVNGEMDTGLTGQEETGSMRLPPRPSICVSFSSELHAGIAESARKSGADAQKGRLNP